MSLAGQFDMDCLSEIDETRSNAVLNNLDVVPDKESVITKAIQLCPFNLAAYEALDQAGLNFLPTHRDILSYLELTDVFCNQLIQSYGIDPNRVPAPMLISWLHPAAEIHVSGRRVKCPYAFGVLCMVMVGLESADSK